MLLAVEPEPVQGRVCGVVGQAAGGDRHVAQGAGAVPVRGRARQVRAGLPPRARPGRGARIQNLTCLAPRDSLWLPASYPPTVIIDPCPTTHVLAQAGAGIGALAAQPGLDPNTVAQIMRAFYACLFALPQFERLQSPRVRVQVRMSALGGGRTGGVGGLMIPVRGVRRGSRRPWRSLRRMSGPMSCLTGRRAGMRIVRS
jgi:hypothetical protein